VIGDAGILDVLGGRLDDAQSRLSESLARCRAYGIRLSISRTLLGFAGIAARRGDTERAARLVGAVLASAKPRCRVAQRLITLAGEAAGPARERDAWTDGVDAGRRLSLDEAVAVALEESLD